MKDKVEDKRQIFGYNAALLILSYGLVRVPLFKLHGMKDWPLFMLGIALVATGILILRGQNPSFASRGYIVTFLLSRVFNTISFDQGGGALSDGWKIWLLIYLTAVIMSLILTKREV